MIGNAEPVARAFLLEAARMARKGSQIGKASAKKKRLRLALADGREIIDLPYPPSRSPYLSRIGPPYSGR